MRIKIALRNLFISQTIIVLFLIFAYLVWFPHSFAKLGGFYDTAFMLILVDLVLGPLLVFIIYKEGKKYLAFDINVLLAIQLAAFLFGAYSLYLKHPAYTVYNNGLFKLVNTSYISQEMIRFDSLKSSYFSRPKMAFVTWPEREQEKLDIMVGVDMFGERDIDERPEYFTPYLADTQKILTQQLNPIYTFNSPQSKEKLDHFIRKHGGGVIDYAFFPVVGNNKKKAVLVLRQESAKPVGIIETLPLEKPDDV